MLQNLRVEVKRGNPCFLKIGENKDGSERSRQFKVEPETILLVE